MSKRAFLLLTRQERSDAMFGGPFNQLPLIDRLLC